VTQANQMSADVLYPGESTYVDGSGRMRDPGEASAIVLPRGVGSMGEGFVRFSDTGCSFDIRVERIRDRFFFSIGEQRP